MEQLTEKLYRGEASPAELHQLFHLLRQSDEASPPEVLERLLAELPEEPVSGDQGDEDGIRKKEQARIFSRVEAGIGMQPRVRRIGGYWRVAAAAAVVIGVAAFLLLFRGEDNTPITFATGPGQIEQLSLPDGSRVTLNGNSSLSYAADWEDGADRFVQLEGEAYFEVTKQPATNAKFSVRTPDLTVEVLGTVFNVSTRREETEVFLEEGKVNVALEGNAGVKTLALEPGESLTYSAKSRQLAPPKPAEIETETAWKRGVLIFREQPLLSILEDLAIANELKFSITDDALKDEVFTLALPTTNMDSTMSLLAKTTQTSIIKRNGEFIISAGGSVE
ncbi:FecR family protein [Lewinella sp. IMCC34191]|uniref:FecR family protein n=1 Tax=Lewinella sp. IMCC34191 TaxID=2259172 RepID=UPI0013006064|nr:FecR domain-containing protein [Lewinella sp. IMCC34191]